MTYTKYIKKILLTGTIAAIPALAIANETADQASAKTEEASPLSLQEEMPKISEAFGHLIGKNLESLGLSFDMKLVVKGIEDSLTGKDSPLTETECIQAITMLQEQAFQKQSEQNLKDAEAFLTSNAGQKGIVAIEEGKLQYKQLIEGTGPAVEEHFTPMIRYIGRFLDGKVFGESSEDELITLDETIPGFQKAIIGMKEGEKREVFIHPDLAYGTNGYMPPNSLLKFEIEVVKANVPKAEEEALSAGVKEQKTEEIAIDHAAAPAEESTR